MSSLLILLNSRRQLLSAILLDSIGILLVSIFLSEVASKIPPYAIYDFSRTYYYFYGLILLCYIIYSWLFGSYTILRWKHFSKLDLVKRVFSSTFATLITIIYIDWLLNLDSNFWLLQRRPLILTVLLTGFWSCLVRLKLKNSFFTKKKYKVFLISEDSLSSSIQKLWQDVNHQTQVYISHSNNLKSILKHSTNSLNIVCISPEYYVQHSELKFLEKYNSCPSDGTILITPVQLFEFFQQRIPTQLLTLDWFFINFLPWKSHFGFQLQLKRFVDVCIATFVLTVTSPVILISCILIFCFDGRPIFYTQKRTGLGESLFTIYKLKTMKSSTNSLNNNWTSVKDDRVTRLGYWLRKFRIDELPQLINVLNGSMSLIGPRPELPQNDLILNKNLPHFMKRYYVKPGLTGWAQVNSHYASSISETSIKLSYDVFYMKNYSLILDIVVLLKTIKIVLKGSGR